ncbi:MAG: hypothetical protein PHQ81_08145 [Methanofollis sp.]|nr:hypothetical protein [Methanofollis sp.]
MRTSHPWLLILLAIYLTTAVLIVVVIVISTWMEVQAEMISTLPPLFLPLIGTAFSARVATGVYASAKRLQRPSA